MLLRVRLSCVSTRAPQPSLTPSQTWGMSWHTSHPIPSASRTSEALAASRPKGATINTLSSLVSIMRAWVRQDVLRFAEEGWHACQHSVEIAEGLAHAHSQSIDRELAN